MLQVFPLLFTGHANIVGLQISTLQIVLSSSHCTYTHQQVKTIPLQALQVDSGSSPEDTPFSNQQPVMPLIT